MASDNGNIGDSSGFPKLSGVFGWRPMTSRQIPVRRPTALSPVSGYGSLYKKDTDGELHSPEMLLNGLVAKFVDGEWLTYGTDGSTVGNGTRSESYRRAPTDSSSREELDAVKNENNFLVWELTLNYFLETDYCKLRCSGRIWL